MSSRVYGRRVASCARLALVLCFVSIAPVSAYNSEEHKLLGDWAASELRIDRSITLPNPTRLSALPNSASVSAYEAAKTLAVGFATNDESDFLELIHEVQDNSYPPGSGYAQLEGNKGLWIPSASYRRSHGLLIAAHAEQGVAREFTFGDLMAIYGDYRRTPFCNDSGACFLTNTNTNAVSFNKGWDCYWWTSGAGAPDGTPALLADCGYRPPPVSTSNYLRRISAGLWPPYSGWGNLLFNTADNETDYFEAGWWGDEMMRIAVSNDWHFSNAAVAWYVGMHRLALHYVDRARTDPVFWNHALHYEAHALHSLSDLFAFGHIVTSRDQTSHGIMIDNALAGREPYQWMQHVIGQGGGVRATNGRISLQAGLPAINEADDLRNRNDFMPSYILGTGWGAWGKTEHDYHDDFNGAGAAVRNLRGDALYIYGDAKLRNTTDSAKIVIKDAIRVSLRSLFDAYVRLDRYGDTVDAIGAEGSAYFNALLYIPVFVQTDPDNHFTGRWTSYARRIDEITGGGRIPDAPTCEMPYINGGESLPPSSTVPCTTFPILAQNQAPEIPVSVAPASNATGQGESVEFRWTRISDPDGDPVTYDLLVCTDSTFPTSCGISFVIPPPLAASGLVGMGLLPLAAVLGFRARRRRRTWVPASAAMLLGIALVSCGGGSGGDVGGPPPPPPPPVNTDVKHTVTGLDGGTTYYWKVVASDGKGGTAESAVNSFVTR